jgi:hypothetical protein
MYHRRPSTMLAAIAFIAAASGISAPSMLPFHAAPSASVLASSLAVKTDTTSRRRAGAFFKCAPPRDRGGCFKHFTLNQRQRRKFNRGRHAAGDRRAFC